MNASCWHAACAERSGHPGMHMSDMGEEWAEARPDLTNADRSVIAELAEIHPTPWRVADEGFGDELVDALDSEVSTTGIEVALAAVVNAYAARAAEGAS